MLFVFKVLRLIFITIDNAIFELVDLLYQLFMLLAETGIFTTEAIRAFSERIYFFLGLIMVFKVSISLIQYILNPDAVNDGKIGAPKLLKNIVFVLVGIIAVPYIFDAAFSLQRIILKDNIIGNLILGTNLSGKGKNAESVVKETGDIMAFSTFTAFLHFNDDYITSECAAKPFDITNGNADASSVCVGKDSKNSQEVIDMLNEFYDSKAGILYEEAYENNNMHKIAGHMKVYNYTFEDAEGDDTFLFDYMLLITTGGGVFLAYVLLIFCFDVAVRAVKLGFLQLIAPIPLIAKIDPKKGDEVFNKWVKECTSTYLNLFIRLVAIYFALYIITLVGSTGKPYNVVTKKDINNPFVYVFIIFGVLLFVKDLPKLIETLTGMKMSGSLSLSKKMKSVPLIGGAVEQGARFAGRTAGRTLRAGAGLAGHLANRGRQALGNGISNRWNNSRLGQAHQQRVRNGTDFGTRFRNSRFVQTANNIGNTIGNAASTAGNAIRDFDQNNGGHFANAFGQIGEDARRTGIGMSGAIQQATGYIERRERHLAEEEAALAHQEAEILNRQVERKTQISQRKSVTEIISKMEERAWTRITEGNGGDISTEYRSLTAELSSANTSGDATRIAAAQRALDNFKDDAISRYISGASVAGSGVGNDATLVSMYDDYVATAQAINADTTTTLNVAINARDGGLLHTQSGNLKGDNSNDSRSMIAENQELERIKEEKRVNAEEKRELAETKRASKPYMGPGFGPGGSNDK